MEFINKWRNKINNEYRTLQITDFAILLTSPTSIMAAIGLLLQVNQVVRN